MPGGCKRTQKCLHTALNNEPFIALEKLSYRNILWEDLRLARRSPAGADLGSQALEVLIWEMWAQILAGSGEFIFPALQTEVSCLDFSRSWAGSQ